MSTEINLPFITADASGPKHLNMTLTRSKLEQLVEDLIEKSRGPVVKALSDAGIRPGDINEVVLVGGQTRMPAVQTLVRRIFDRDPHRGVNPDEVVAVGAAIQAGVLTGDVKDVLLLDVTPLSLGIETLGGVFTRLIERNTTIPTQKSQVFSTASDSQPSVEINVLQGEREFAKDNRSLGSFILDGIPPAPRGVPQIEVTFDIDANGIVNVSARDKGTGREQKITIVASSGLSKDQIDRMVRDAESHAAEDKRRKEEVEERNLADSAAYRAEKSIAELGDKITSEQKGELESKIADIRAALSTDDVARIKSSREALEQSFHRISESIYRQAGAGAGGPGADFGGGADQGNPSDQGGPHDDTIEGEYKEM
jgi:molecular chaperone DnaK